MNHFILFAAEGGGIVDIAKSTGETFGFNVGLFISQVISFVVVALALRQWAYKPILAILEERRQRIAEGLANADKIKIELANAQAKSQEILNQAGVQATKMIEEARGAAAKVLETESQKAIATANQIIAKAKESNDAELARMKTELRREVGRLVVSTTAKVAGKVLSADDQQRLADETNKQLAA